MITILELLVEHYGWERLALIISAIQTRGWDPEAIRNYLTDIQYNDGLTGPISFDELGNRRNAARIIRIVNGKPIFAD